MAQKTLSDPWYLLYYTIMDILKVDQLMKTYMYSVDDIK